MCKDLYSSCSQCPRRCGADRNAGKTGFCREPAEVRIALASTFYVGELMTQYHKIVGKTHNSLPILMIIGIIYFVLNFVLSKGLSVFERRMKASA